MTPLQTVDYLLKNAWDEDKTIQYVKELMKFPWGKVKKDE